MFKVNTKVRRNPRIWKNDTAVFTVVQIAGGKFLCQRSGKTRNTFTGKLEAHTPMPYSASELVAA